MNFNLLRCGVIASGNIFSHFAVHEMFVFSTEFQIIYRQDISLQFLFECAIVLKLLNKMCSSAVLIYSAMICISWMNFQKD